MIRLVFQKAHSGCLVEKGLNEIFDIKDFAQDLDYSKCSENITQLLFLCQLPDAWWEWMMVAQ